MFKTLRAAGRCAKCYNERNIHTSCFYFHNIQLVKKEHWEEKMQFWLRKYEDLFGITKLSELQQRVLEVQNKVQSTQEKRRQVQDEIFRVQKKLQEMNDILHKMSLGDNMYISVATQCTSSCKKKVPGTEHSLSTMLRHLFIKRTSSDVILIFMSSETFHSQEEKSPKFQL
ncbi:unnamed protein product [Larinioides sclopetarius]|uniref:Uncharacterized protein n=1 Tax=Larinioides sclopetarius TaxID=280406 RepID=A0AAV2BHX1_9ARAC